MDNLCTKKLFARSKGSILKPKYTYVLTGGIDNMMSMAIGIKNPPGVLLTQLAAGISAVTILWW